MDDSLSPPEGSPAKVENLSPKNLLGKDLVHKESAIRLSSVGNFSFGGATFQGSPHNQNNSGSKGRSRLVMNHNLIGVPPLSHQIAPEFSNFSVASHAIDDGNNQSQRQVESQSTHSNSPHPPPASMLHPNTIGGAVVADHVHNLQNQRKNPYSSNKAFRHMPGEGSKISIAQLLLDKDHDYFSATPLTIPIPKESDLPPFQITRTAFPFPIDSRLEESKTSSALKLINTQKFIEQNNFMPVPPIHPSATMLIQSQTFLRGTTPSNQKVIGGAQNSTNFNQGTHTSTRYEILQTAGSTSKPRESSPFISTSHANRETSSNQNPRNIPDSTLAFQQTLLLRAQSRQSQIHPESPEFFFSHGEFVDSQNADLTTRLRRAQSIDHANDVSANILAPTSTQRETNGSNSPFNRSNKAGGGSPSHHSRKLHSPSFLTHEQRLIIDNASEEQGNSDQSIEKIVMINEDLLNQSIEDDNQQQQTESEEQYQQQQDEESKNEEEHYSQEIQSEIHNDSSAFPESHREHDIQSYTYYMPEPEIYQQHHETMQQTAHVPNEKISRFLVKNKLRTQDIGLDQMQQQRINASSMTNNSKFNNFPQQFPKQTAVYNQYQQIESPSAPSRLPRYSGVSSLEHAPQQINHVIQRKKIKLIPSKVDNAAETLMTPGQGSFRQNYNTIGNLGFGSPTPHMNNQIISDNQRKLSNSSIQNMSSIGSLQSSNSLGAAFLMTHMPQPNYKITGNGSSLDKSPQKGSPTNKVNNQSLAQVLNLSASAAATQSSAIRKRNIVIRPSNFTNIHDVSNFNQTVGNFMIGNLNPNMTGSPKQNTLKNKILHQQQQHLPSHLQEQLVNHMNMKKNLKLALSPSHQSIGQPSQNTQNNSANSAAVQRNSSPQKH